MSPVVLWIRQCFCPTRKLVSIKGAFTPRLTALIYCITLAALVNAGKRIPVPEFSNAFHFCLRCLGVKRPAKNEIWLKGEHNPPKILRPSFYKMSSMSLKCRGLTCSAVLSSCRMSAASVSLCWPLVWPGFSAATLCNTNQSTIQRLSEVVGDDGEKSTAGKWGDVSGFDDQFPEDLFALWGRHLNLCLDKNFLHHTHTHTHTLFHTHTFPARCIPATQHSCTKIAHERVCRSAYRRVQADILLRGQSKPGSAQVCSTDSAKLGWSQRREAV